MDSKIRAAIARGANYEELYLIAEAALQSKLTRDTRRGRLSLMAKQFVMVDDLLKEPKQSFTINELAQRFGHSHRGLQRCINHLKQLNLVTEVSSETDASPLDVQYRFTDTTLLKDKMGADAFDFLAIGTKYKNFPEGLTEEMLRSYIDPELLQFFPDPAEPEGDVS